MRPHRNQSSLAILLCVLALAAAPATQPKASPQEVLKQKWLHQVDRYFLLQDDINLRELLRPMRGAEYKVQEGSKRQAEVNSEIDFANSKMDELNSQSIAISDQLTRIHKSARASYNHWVEQFNAVQSQVRKGKKYITQLQAELAAIDVPIDVYDTDVNRCATQMQRMVQRYQVLANDADVKRALASLNRTSSPAVRLGPSIHFSEQLPIVLKLQKELMAVCLRWPSRSLPNMLCICR